MSNASLFRRLERAERVMLAAVMPRTPERADEPTPDFYARMAERLVPALRVPMSEVIAYAS